MLTVYAIIATFFLGMFVRHNSKEIHQCYRAAKLSRKVRRDINKLMEKDAASRCSNHDSHTADSPCLVE